MSFVYPWFLLALSVVSIPIIIHLFHFRRFRKVYFSNIRFLEQLSDETQKQARLKHLLVLLSRILALVLLVLAFARPYIPVEESSQLGERSYVSIFVDNSFSMEAGEDPATLLDQARETAREIVASYSPSDRFQLLTNDFEGRHQRFVSRDEFLIMLEEVDFSPAVRMLSLVTNRQNELIRQEGVARNAFAFVISDFQKNISDFENFTGDSLIRQFYLPFQAERPANLFIDSVWMESPVRMPGQVITLKARIFNDSPDDMINQPVRLYVNQSQRSVATYDVRARGYTQVELSYTPGNDMQQNGWIEINDFPVTFDDRFYFSFQLTDQVPVLSINAQNQNPFIQALLGNTSTFSLNNAQVSALDFSDFGNYNLIILNGIDRVSEGLALELRRYVESGGTILIFPSANPDFVSYNAFLGAMNVNTLERLDTVSTRVVHFNEMHPVYTGVFDRIPENIDLPGVNQYFVIGRRTAAQDVVMMQLQNGNPFFTSTPVERGQVFLSAVPADDSFSNFPRHAIFVPTIYNIGLQSAAMQSLYYTLGDDEHISLRSIASVPGMVFRVRGEGLDVIPESRIVNNVSGIHLRGQIREAGNFRLYGEEEFLRTLALNYDRKESLLESYSPAEITDQAPGVVNVLRPGAVAIDAQIEMLQAGKQLWKWFLIAALAFLMLEILLLRFMK